MREVALVARESLGGQRPRRLAEDVGLARHPHQRPHRAALDVPRGAARGAGAGARRGTARAGHRHQQVVEGGAPRRLPRLQPERQGPHGRLGLLRAADAGRAGLHAAWPGRTCRTSRWPTSRLPPCRRSSSVGDPHAGIDDAVGSLDGLLELSARHEAEGLGDAPGRRIYRKAEGEPPRVQPSRQRRPDADYDTPEAEAEREKSRAAMERRFARARGARHAGRHTARRPPGDAASAMPVIEISRAARKEDALAGLERWKARHPDAATHLEPADELVDSMRGRFTTWTRIRVNLIHVPPEARPGPGSARPRLRPLDRLRGSGPLRPAGAPRAEEAGHGRLAGRDATVSRGPPRGRGQR